jgi:hypothetical protein
MGDIISHREMLRGFVKPELCPFVSESSRKLRQQWPRFFLYIVDVSGNLSEMPKGKDLKR